ncbi:DUF6223 family protein [Chitinophaga lutea]|nr:DUF6223 family protein [Chitinophaga lutea]
MTSQGKTISDKCFPFILPACLALLLFVLAAGAVVAQTTPDGSSPAVTGITAGRARSLVGAVIALASLVMGWRVKARSKAAGHSGAGNGGSLRTQAIIALLLGGIAIILSVVHLGASAGAVYGSGSGKAGAIVALVLGLAGAALSGLSLRTKRG